MTYAPKPQIVDIGDLPEYPLGVEERLDSHWFIAWERRRWLNSSMRLKGTPECRGLHFDLINICYDQQPIGTLPDDKEVLAKLLMVERGHFEALCKLEYPLCQASCPPLYFSSISQVGGIG